MPLLLEGFPPKCQLSEPPDPRYPGGKKTRRGSCFVETGSAKTDPCGSDAPVGWSERVRQISFSQQALEKSQKVQAEQHRAQSWGFCA